MLAFVKKTFFVSPQVAFKSAFVVTLGAFVKKFFLSPQVAFTSAFVVTLVAFAKKTSQCQWSLASQDGFVSLVVCFDLLGPKFLMRAGRLKKGARQK